MSHEKGNDREDGKQLTFAALVGALAFAAGAQAQETMSPLVKQMFNGGWPDKASVEQLNKDRLYYDAIEAYRLTLPALNTIGMRDGSEAKFGKGYNVLPIWKDRMNAKTWVPTPNCRNDPKDQQAVLHLVQPRAHAYHDDVVTKVPGNAG